MVTLSEATLSNLLSIMFISCAATLCSKSCKTNIVGLSGAEVSVGGRGVWWHTFCQHKVFILGEWKYGNFS
jgi:hypothetical protein